MQIIKFIFIISFILSNLYGASSEDELKAVVIGKVSHFIKWKKEDTSKEFIITVFQNHAFDSHLDILYKDKKIHNKPVKINYVENIQEIEFTHILYVTKHSQKDQEAIIKHTQKNSIVTISENKGFAQRGGVIQLYFVSQKIRLKINNEVTDTPNFKISSRLLSIAKIVKGND